jgi:hypothetical protein
MNDSRDVDKKAERLYRLAVQVAEVRNGKPPDEDLDRKLKAWAEDSVAAEASRDAAENPASALRRNATKVIDEYRARNQALLSDVLTMPPPGRATRGDEGMVELLSAVIGAAHRRSSGATPAEPPPEGSRERRIGDLGDGLLALLRFEVDRYVQHTFGPLAQQLHAVVDSVQKQMKDGQMPGNPSNRESEQKERPEASFARRRRTGADTTEGQANKSVKRPVRKKFTRAAPKR